MSTIFALSTAPGKSGVAVVRVSGEAAAATLRALGVTPLPAPRMATLAALRVAEEVIDRALVFYFPAPASFTGEDVVEYHIHGSRAVIARLLAVFAALPTLRPAEPGEFARRAFLKGKMDLTAAEGLADLIDAETEAQRRQALRIMQGDAAKFFETLRAGILHALAYLEAYIDFPDEDIPEETLSSTGAEIQSIIRAIEHQLADNRAAEKVRDGITVAILGPPNAGKSSLMNLLARRDVAIVSPTPGTTRDVIEVQMDIGGYSVLLCDTAGIRESQEAIEREGIRRSLERAATADIKVVVLDASYPSLPLSGTPPQSLPLLGGGQVGVSDMQSLLTDSIILLNKSDLLSPAQAGMWEPLPACGGLRGVSCRTCCGISRYGWRPRTKCGVLPLP